MVLRKEITTRITSLLKQNPQGLSITEIVQGSGINRNTAGRYLDNLLISGQVEMRNFGMAKIYSLSHRLPVSSVLSLSSEYVMQLDAGLRVTFLNHPFAGLMGITEKEILGKNIEFSEIPQFFDEAYPSILAWLQDGIGGAEFRGELEVPSQDMVFSCRITPTVLGNGQKGVSVIFEDITERKESEALLRDSEARLKLALSGSETGMWEVDIPSMKGTVDERAAQILGHQRNDIGPYTFDWDALTHPDDVPLIRKRFMDCLEGRTPFFESEHRMLQASGQWIWVSGKGNITHRRPDGTPLRIMGTIHDITRRKKAEEALRESEEKFRALVNNATDMITLHGFGRDGLPGQYIEVNEEACHRLHYTRQELLSMSPKDLIAPECAGEMSRNARRLNENGHATFEMVHLTREGHRIPVEINAHVFEFRGAPVVLALVRDITGRKQAEDQLRLLKISVDSAYDEVFWMDLDANILYVNDAACRTTGYSREELYVMKIFTLDPDFTPAIWKRSIEDLRKNKKQFFQTRHRRKDGVILNVEVGSVYVTRGREEYAFCFVRDITERITREREQQQNEQSTRFIAEHSVDIIHRLTPECTCTYTSPSVTTLLGYSQQEILGRPLLLMVHPEDLPGVMRDLSAVSSSGQDTITSTFRFRHREGHYLWFESTTRIIRDASGTVKEFISISRDITGRKSRQVTKEQP